MLRQPNPGAERALRPAGIGQPGEAIPPQHGDHTMSINIEDPPGKDRYEIRCAPQVLTDILVQVRDLRNNDKSRCLFTFEIGHLLLQEVEGDAVLSGEWKGGNQRRAVLLRWASLLECYAATIRAAIDSGKVKKEPAQ